MEEKFWIGGLGYERSRTSNASILHVGKVGRNSLKVKNRRHHGPVYIVYADDDGREIGRAKEDICEFVTIKVRYTEGDRSWSEKINGLRINSKLYDMEGKIHHLNVGEYKTIGKFTPVPEWADEYLEEKYYSHKSHNPEYIKKPV